jgi:leucyl-tRNA synthetase
MKMQDIEKKWQKIWEDTELYRFNYDNIDHKQYVLEMFSYPSGANLHVGHWFNFGPSDSYARFKRMQGYEVFQPMGFDAFGLPAENYAIKTGIHPKDSTYKNIETMEKQLKAMGATFNFENEIITCSPDYYKWTQWIFLQLYKKGLAVRKEAPVNWCPSCNTVLANEQVVNNLCERCDSEVIKKNLTQWFFKITDYAEELLADIDSLDWPEKTKLMQKNWIGKSVGGEIEFDLESGQSFRVFTTRADTLFGTSYVVLAPEHPLVNEITTPEQASAVKEYREETAKVNEIERLSTAREKSGVFTGAYAINPINGIKVPVWIADYVLYSYGTGAVMGVPSHDDRDFIFANKYNLPITRVIKGVDVNDELPFTGYGVMVNSGEFDGLTSEQGKTAIIDKLKQKGKGEHKVNYRLRDWLVSRQRYWGAPIPIIHCEKCGTVPVPEEDLPVELPYDVDFTPDGKSPLIKHEGFMNVKCPLCGAPAKRDPDTLDTFVCSSWYFLRYADPHNDKEAFNKDIINKMLPVDKYIGGAEHACMHLLYARFFTKALRDMGYLDFSEPFKSLVHQGTILGPDGNRMSKSRGNVVSPDSYISEYGSDAFRMYLMFGFSYIEGGPWNADGIKAVSRFMDRVERIVLKASDNKSKGAYGTAEKELDYVRHNTIDKVTQDMENFSFNTAIARIMEFVNALYKYDNEAGEINSEMFMDAVSDLILLLAPITPHFAEELNEIIGGGYSVFNKRYPIADKSKMVLEQVEIVVQINSRNRIKINVSSSLSREELIKVALSDANVIKLLEGKSPKKVIAIPGKLVNLVI